MVDFSERIARAGEEIIAASASDVADELNRQINQIIGWPYRAATGIAVDREELATAPLGSLIFTGDQERAQAERSASVSADALACAIDVSYTLDVDGFRRAYLRIAQAKSLKKSPAARELVYTTTTLGLIFAVTASVPLEVLAHELNRMNMETPSAHWPDMVVIVSRGLINYAVQFPGEPSLTAQWLPPAEGALTNNVPAIYVVMVIRPSVGYAFNQMMYHVLTHLDLFSPGSKLPDVKDVVNGLPNSAIVQCGYQYNTRGELRPVPPDQIQGRMFPSRPLHLQDARGKVLASLKFLQWQDGGVILLWGQLPLEGVMVFLNRAVIQKMGVIKREGLQISHVLPITEQDFHEMLRQFQQRSNIAVRPDAGTIIIKKFADEGASSPFMARLLIGMIKLAEALAPVERQAFEDAYHPLVTTLLEIRTVEKDCMKLIMHHREKVLRGTIVSRHGSSIHITESIDREARRAVDQFLTVATRSFKGKMQRVTGVLQTPIGFLYQKPESFERGIAALTQSHRPLAEYLREARLWGDLLVEARNDLEHGDWQLPPVAYTANNDQVSMNEPVIKGQAMTAFISYITDRLMCFVEDVTADCLQRRMPPGLTLTEILVADRPAELPVRFQPTPTQGGLPGWQIAYHTSSFDMT